ncbi:Hemerythrin-like domain-containing protein [Hathewaya proteolytica DSM 3090]|uniref:Hemerythrin-like domain-containing protein n=1 Tax=Hathewaya proteolytica DSM 3090 TaxID=1121331 RepID=A0A1M6SZF9_9CLOT|nr:hemerythrin domain-containing protein [Hathewaya proteolytica]SHK50046.1 Hemerythrin-like domain-containing protein [Hathewaya proteolytica DSM 3090]
MDGISLMVEEHENITRMLKIVRKACVNVMNGNEIDFVDFANMIEFIRFYADKHHHEKEEKFLFNKMVDEIGGAAEKLVKYGMLVEHDLGRFYIKELEDSLAKVKAGDQEAKLDVISNAISYTHLLTRHIDKENNVAYPFARRKLSQETLSKIHEQCQTFEEERTRLGVQGKYIEMLKCLEVKYK